MEKIPKRRGKECSANSNLQLIFTRLHKYLMENRRFTACGLNRDSLAVAVRTNEKYLARAVRCFADGKTVGQFIESLRMEYAKRLLLQNPDYTIDAIARECGATSRSTFYRIFRKYYDCTPCELQEKSEKKEQWL